MRNTNLNRFLCLFVIFLTMSPFNIYGSNLSVGAGGIPYHEGICSLMLNASPDNPHEVTFHLGFIDEPNDKKKLSETSLVTAGFLETLGLSVRLEETPTELILIVTVASLEDVSLLVQGVRLLPAVFNLKYNIKLSPRNSVGNIFKNWSEAMLRDYFRHEILANVRSEPDFKDRIIAVVFDNILRDPNFLKNPGGFLVENLEKLKASKRDWNERYKDPRYHALTAVKSAADKGLLESLMARLAALSAK